MRRKRRLSPGLIAALIAIVTILIAIPVTVVAAYIPAAVTDHKPAWIAGLAVLLLVLAVMAVLSARPAEPEPAPVKAEPIVVGEIPREPPAFVDRAAIGRLAAAAESGRAAVVCAVTGLRGVGKTQVAAAYARSRIADGWGLVGWVNAEAPDVLLAGLARVAEAAGVADPDGDSSVSAGLLRDYLDAWPGPGLLVFDNAADPDVLRPLLPAAGGTQLVVTSTDRGFADWGVPVDVAVFARPESVRYLADRMGLDDPPGADAVADRLGDLPLALAQAAAVITRRRWTFDRYLREIARLPVEDLLGRVPGGDYPRPAAAALLLSVQAAEDADPSGLAGLVLRVVAVLSPDGVPRDLLEGLGAAGDLDAAVELCTVGSLLTWSVTGDAVIMHRLLGRVLRERDAAAGRLRETVEAAAGVVEAVLFAEDQAWSRRAEGAELAIQVEALWDASDTVGPADLVLAGRLLQARSWAVRQLSAAADLTMAIETGTRVLADAVRVLGEDYPGTLASRDNLAAAYRSAGRLDEAISLSEQTLADCVRVLGSDHPQTLLSRFNLAYAYRSAERLDEAISLHEQTLASRVRVLGADHPQTLTSRNYVAGATGRQAGWTRRSRCTSRPSPTGCGSSAPTTRTP